MKFSLVCGDDYVASCERKAECDPRFGSEWSEKSSCPLNVCCSKFGFCGTTSEFCGKKKVKRPSYDKSSHILQRVVGYYETWSTRRRCKQFWPEKIPLGIYTHINMAFAVIDPETFTVRPSLTADLELYKRVSRLKKDDSDLKVFIAISGWSYNDPGPTSTTFSDLAASKSNQDKFFDSLTKFIANGRPEDFANFSKFLKNLKARLKRTSGRDGLSITLPTSFYEILNAHTNLTEIQNSLDLLWRNNIPPNQVVLGLAFYGRAYTVADTTCTKPGCLFASEAEPGDCSHEVGILMNSEIDEIIVNKKPKVIFDKKAAVKMITWDENQWVSFDDADTFQLKADFARSQCLGGLMAWAISHNQENRTYSRAPETAAQRKFKALPDQIKTDNTVKIKHDQCKWTNCGDLCPAGWVLLRQAPKCGWYNFNNSDCEGKCPDRIFELGGTNAGYSTVNSNYQAACCTSGKKSTTLYEKCEWGASFKYDSYKYPAAKSDVLLKSCNGNRGSAYTGDWKSNKNEERKLCCDTSDENMTFDDCKWENDYSSTSYTVVPEKGSESESGYCFSSCPGNKVRVAMESLNTCARKTGSRAKCCSPNYTTTKNVVDPMCHSGYGYNDGDIFDPVDKRAFTEVTLIGNASQHIDAPTSLIKRQQQTYFTSNSAMIIAVDIIYAFRGTSMTAKALKQVEVWNKVVNAQFTHLVTSELIPFLKNVLREFYTAVAEDLAGRIIYNLGNWNRMVGGASSNDEDAALKCDISSLDNWDPEYAIDPDTYGTNSNGVTKWLLYSLDKREGNRRPFTIDCGIDPATGLRRTMIIESAAYPNGEEGNALERANGLTVRFALANEDDCTDVSIDPNSPNNLWESVSIYLPLMMPHSTTHC
ncbi:unnamed protein product [Penicillium salamii]|uniref:chitinase n=1 Tax=Penicillium salamii TaxID=1612424 RepID=A0A9W4JH79_9EURO|nr:unnamed protein product [Penicillium salamii]